MEKVKVRGLSVFYGKKKVLNEINVSFKDRSVVGIIGPSGCGKSTFLRVLNRMNDFIEKYSMVGQVEIDGKNILDQDVVQLRRKVGMVFQRSNPFPKSIFENVAFGLRISGEKDEEFIRKRVEDSLKKSALWSEVKQSLHRSAFKLSGGQQQRLCIARSLAIDPDIILMDEPTSALDPASTVKIEELVLELKKDHTIIIVTHNMHQAARVSDETLFFMNGDLIEFGETKKIFSQPDNNITENYIKGRFG